MHFYNGYIYFIVLVKIIFILLSAYYVYLKAKGKTDQPITIRIKGLKEKAELLFIILMSILLIYLFNPRSNKLHMINNETQMLLYIFGFILIITAKWNVIIFESKWFITIQGILGKDE